MPNNNELKCIAYNIFPNISNFEKISNFKQKIKSNDFKSKFKSRLYGDNFIIMEINTKENTINFSQNKKYFTYENLLNETGPSSTTIVNFDYKLLNNICEDNHIINIFEVNDLNDLMNRIKFYMKYNGLIIKNEEDLKFDILTQLHLVRIRKNYTDKTTYNLLTYTFENIENKEFINDIFKNNFNTVVEKVEFIINNVHKIDIKKNLNEMDLSQYNTYLAQNYKNELELFFNELKSQKSNEPTTENPITENLTLEIHTLNDDQINYIKDQFINKDIMPEIFKTLNISKFSQKYLDGRQYRPKIDYNMSELFNLYEKVYNLFEKNKNKIEIPFKCFFNSLKLLLITVYFNYNNNDKSIKNIYRMNCHPDKLTHEINKNYNETKQQFNSLTTIVNELNNHFINKIETDTKISEILINMTEQFELLKTIIDNEETDRKIKSNGQMTGGQYKFNHNLHISMYIHKIIKVLYYRYLLNKNNEITYEKVILELLINFVLFELLNSNYTLCFLFDQITTLIIMGLYIKISLKENWKINPDSLTGIFMVPYYLVFI